MLRLMIRALSCRVRKNIRQKLLIFFRQMYEKRKFLSEKEYLDNVLHVLILFISLSLSLARSLSMCVRAWEYYRESALTTPLVRSVEHVSRSRETQKPVRELNSKGIVSLVWN